MNARGVFHQMPPGREAFFFNPVGAPRGGPPLPPLSVAVFNNNFDKDKFENTSLVVDGKVGDLKLVYAGGYLVRNIEQQQDYTNYSRGVYGYYYQIPRYSKKTASGNAYSPSATWQGTG